MVTSETSSHVATPDTSSRGAALREALQAFFSLDGYHNFVYQLIDTWTGKASQRASCQEAGYGYGNMGSADGNGRGHDVEL